MTAQLVLPGGSTEFEARVESSSDDVNVQTGTLLVELSVNDNSGALIPGDFVDVRFDRSNHTKTILLPASAVIFRSSRLQVAVVDATNHISLRDLTVKNDRGEWLEVASGFAADDRIVDSPPDALSDGDEVHPVNLPTATANR